MSVRLSQSADQGSADIPLIEESDSGMSIRFSQSADQGSDSVEYQSDSADQGSDSDPSI